MSLKAAATSAYDSLSSAIHHRVPLSISVRLLQGLERRGLVERATPRTLLQKITAELPYP
ncbi:hypothetical protein [Nonomuraea sp. NPDC049158]|uniref:hypothetical protein n=1 Tax=Nonomuraea sp. NPDC049158 TaxID=3155649 RepID=UPI00340C7B14